MPDEAKIRDMIRRHYEDGSPTYDELVEAGAVAWLDNKIGQLETELIEEKKCEK